VFDIFLVEREDETVPLGTSPLVGEVILLPSKARTKGWVKGTLKILGKVQDFRA
jgi:hypothetical protein